MARSGPRTAQRPPGENLIAWRSARLRASGFGRELAASIARDGRYDLHALLELVDRGCPAALAARIQAPLDEIRTRR
jgi:hypothetical protein